MRQRLEHDAVPFGEAQKRGKLLLRRVGIERELQSYALEAYRYFLREAQRSAEVEITFSLERGIA